MQEFLEEILEEFFFDEKDKKEKILCVQCKQHQEDHSWCMLNIWQVFSFDKFLFLKNQSAVDKLYGADVYNL